MSESSTITFEALEKRNVELERENYELRQQLQPEREEPDRPDGVSKLKDQLAKEEIERLLREGRKACDAWNEELTAERAKVEKLRATLKSLPRWAYVEDEH